MIGDDDAAVLTLGEALVSLLPSEPVPLDRAVVMKPFVGGAELNFAIGLSRLGVRVAWVGRVGADPFGRLVLRTLSDEGVDTRWVREDPECVTGVYFREWLGDGQRRPYYYRMGSAASRLTPSELPSDEQPRTRWLHVTGITPALGEAPRRTVAEAVARAAATGTPISLDPNYRPSLWSPDEARAALLPLTETAQVLLMSLREAELLFDVRTPEQALVRAHAAGVTTAVVRLGRNGAVGSRDGGVPVHVPAASTNGAPDPVGAGDGFNAGFVAAALSGADLRTALAVGNHVGARAVETIGDHPYPHAHELPPELAGAIGALA